MMRQYRSEQVHCSIAWFSTGRPHGEGEDLDLQDGGDLLAAR